jgi:hypothetical protein
MLSLVSNADQSSVIFLIELRRIGAFLAGLAIPREGGLCIKLTEKLEDMVSIIFLPLVCCYVDDVGFQTNKYPSILHYLVFRQICAF